MVSLNSLRLLISLATAGSLLFVLGQVYLAPRLQPLVKRLGTLATQHVTGGATGFPVRDGRTTRLVLPSAARPDDRDGKRVQT